MAEASNSLHVTAGATPEQRRSNDETILDNRRDLAEQLEQLLVSSSGDKNALLAGIRNEGMANAQGETRLEEDDVQTIIHKN